MESPLPLIVQVEVDVDRRIEQLPDSERLVWIKRLIDTCRSNETRLKIAELITR